MNIADFMTAGAVAFAVVGLAFGFLVTLYLSVI